MTGPTAAKTVTDMDHKAKHKASLKRLQVLEDEDGDDMTMMAANEDGARVNIQIYFLKNSSYSVLSFS